MEPNALKVSPTPGQRALSTPGATPDDSSAHIDRVGDVIAAKYQLERVLGQGGMGDVWIARNLLLDCRVALKLIRRDLRAADAAERLLDEARTEAQVGHPAIVRVFDFGTTEQATPFIVMELLEGRTLGDLMREHQRLDPVTVAQILLPVLDGLISAHERGIVHRDLTPENIFLAREARRIQPKIVDFGIALLRWQDMSARSEDGTVVGCPRYMSPEQARGEDDLDHRTDLWTLCVVLYEAVMGRPPFDGPDWRATLEAVTEQPALPVDDLATREPELWRIIEKGLTKDANMRWQTADDLGKALSVWLVRKGIHQDISGGALEEFWLTGAPGPVADVLDSLAPVGQTVMATLPSDGDSSDRRTERPGEADGRRRRSTPAGVVLAAVADRVHGFLAGTRLSRGVTATLAGATIALSLTLGLARVTLPQPEAPVTNPAAASVPSSPPSEPAAVPRAVAGAADVARQPEAAPDRTQSASARGTARGHTARGPVTPKPSPRVAASPPPRLDLLDLKEPY